MLDLGIDLNVWPWVWLFIAVVFALIELTILGGSFILLPFAISAFIASLLGFYDVAIEIQWAVFVFGGGVLFVGFYRLRPAERGRRPQPSVSGKTFRTNHQATREQELSKREDEYVPFRGQRRDPGSARWA